MTSKSATTHRTFPFVGNGEMAERSRKFDWCTTSLGDVDAWSPALRGIVQTVLESPFAMCILAGEDRNLVYNDAFSAVLGEKHQWAIGSPAAQARLEASFGGKSWLELIDVGEASAHHSKVEFPISSEDRGTSSGSVTFSVSPVRNEDASIAATLIVAVETPKEGLLERELTLLHPKSEANDVALPSTTRDQIETLLSNSRTALRDAERSESRYRFLADSIPVHVWTATTDGMLDFVSERTADYLGFSGERLLQDGWLNALHPEDVERATQQWVGCVESGADYEIEFRLWSAEHVGYRWHLVRATAQRDAEGSILHWFGSNTDIHERKGMESELKNLTRQAEEANRSKSDFLNAMSHELRTPLNAIGGYAQLLELGVRGPITEEQKVDLRRIQRSKTHLDGLVSGVLDFAKMGSGQINIRSGDIDVMTMLGSVVDMVRPQLAERGLTLAPWEVPETLAVIGDEDRVRQILLNIVANAVKFTPEGGVISFSVSADSTDVVISVTDTGIGIAEEELERMFEPFVQAKSPLHVAGVGVGLGLAISMQLARAMEGDIKVTSSVGSGSTFALQLRKSR